MRGLIWDNFDQSLSSVITLSEIAPPVPEPPRNEFLNLAALNTIVKRPDLFKIVTPIRVERFATLLQKHPNQSLVLSVCRALRDGFWPWAITNDAHYPETWDYSRREIREEHQRVFLRNQRDEEIKLGQYSQSFGTDLLPGMYSMPIGTAPKPHTDGLRLVNDLSAGEFSLNSMIPRGEASVQLDGIQPLAAAIRAAHRLDPTRPIVVFKSDVSRAYRLMPMHPLWQIRQIVTIDGQRHVDRCNCFGGRSSGRIWVTFMSLVLWIAQEVLNIKDLFVYIDDVFSWQYAEQLEWYDPYGTHFPSKQTQLLRLWDELGIPHKLSKQLFGSELTIIGFHFNLHDMKITMSDESVRDLSDFVNSFLTRKCRRTLRDLQRLAGWLNWALNIHPYLRPALASIYEKIGGKENPNLQLWISERIKHDLRWFSAHFADSRGISFLFQMTWDIDRADVILTSDACLTGIGFYCPQAQKGLHVSMPRGDKIYHMEIFAVACAFFWACDHFGLAKRLLIFSDNMNTVDTFFSLKATGFPNTVLRVCCDRVIRENRDLRVRHITTHDNWVADSLSRGIFTPVQDAGIHVSAWSPPPQLSEVSRTLCGATDNLTGHHGPSNDYIGSGPSH